MSSLGSSSKATAIPTSEYQLNNDRAEKAWSKLKLKLPTSPSKARSSLKKLIRTAVLSSKRDQIWLAVSGAAEMMGKAGGSNRLQSLFVAHFQERLPPTEVKTPCLGGVDYSDTNQGSRKHDIELSEDQKQSWRLIMHVFAAEHPEIRYAPAIADILAMLLLYLTREEAFSVLQCMVNPIDADDRSFVICGDNEASLFALTFSDLIKLRLPKVAKHMEARGVDPVMLGNQWFSRSFVGSLPLPVALRVFDIQISEGLKVIYRIGLAILKLCQKEILDCDNAVNIVGVIKACAKSCVDDVPLFKSAFSLYLSRKHAAKFDARNVGREAEVLEMLTEGEGEGARGGGGAFHRPKLEGESVILNVEEFDVMWSWLGQSKGLKDAKRLFSTSDDGYLLSTLLDKVKDCSPTYIIFKSIGENGAEGTVFGAYVTDPWDVQKGYFGTGESFVFTLRPHVDVYPWSRENDYFQSCTGRGKDGRLSVGLSALSIDSDLHHGSSQPCATYSTPMSLNGQNDRFECAHVEVWGIV